MDQGNRFTLVKPSSHQVVALNRGARGSKRLKRPKRLKFEPYLKDPKTPKTDSLGKNQFL